MYHCNVKFYLIGDQDKLFGILEKAEPLQHFTHEFFKSSKPDKALLGIADVIVVDIKENAASILWFLRSHKKKESEMILLADREQTDLLANEDLSSVNDIWTMPMTENEIKFRFLKWQKNYKVSKDYWQTGNYLDSLINSVPHMIWFKDRAGAHMKVNNFFCKVVNKTMEQIQGRGHYYIWDLTPDEYAKGEFICMESEYVVMDKRETCIFDEDVKIGGEMRKLQTYKSPLFDLDGSVMGTVGVAMDVTQELLYKETIIKNANTDFLTGLYNRRYVYEYIDKIDEKHITVFGIDLNSFKSINDIYGHAEGDHALVLTAQVLQECMSEHLVARVGGDEFMVVVFGELTEQEIEETKKMIEDQLDSAYIKEENLKLISASIGAAHTDKGKEGFDALVGEADSIMYSEKEKKKSSRR